MTDPKLSKFAQQIEARRLAKEARDAKAAAPVFADDLIPEAQYERSEESSELERILAGVSIVDAYIRWCGKMKPKVRPGQKESIMISCPQPGHKDSNPSAWLNTEKNVWHCAACNTGGDMFDIAANHFGVSNYKDAGRFPDLKRQMVKDLGYVVEKSKKVGVPDQVYLPVVVETASATVPVPASTESNNNLVPVPIPTSPLAKVIGISDGVEITESPRPDLDFELDDLFIAPTFNWRDVVTPGTFLDTYMGCCILDDAAEEYHFWNGMLAISIAAGRQKVLADGRPVHANLMTCIIGRSGDRKSRSIEHMTNLVAAAMPYDKQIHSGSRLMQGVASGEQLISMFDSTINDPTTGKPITNGSVNGLIEYPELSDLTNRAMRPGNTLKSTLHQLADAKPLVGTASRTGGALQALNAYANLSTTTQPDSLKNLLQENDTKSGFLNRFIFVTGKPKKHVAIGGAKIDITPAVLPLKQIYGQPDRTVTWTQEAVSLFEQHFYEKLEPAQQSDDMLARIDLTTKKLILLFCLNEGLSEVSVEAVRKGIYLFDYLVSVYRLTGERVLGQHQNAEIYKEIMRHIQNLTVKSKFGPTKKNVKDRLARKGWDPLIVDRIFDSIKEDENISVNMGDQAKPGRKAEHYQWVGATA